MIEDEELRELYKIESEEHLQKLDAGLLQLEETPRDQALLDEVFREAHSLKGASRMLGVDGVETLSHVMEDILGKARRGDIQLDSALIDRLYYALDHVRLLVAEAVTGESVRVDVVATADVLTGARPVPTRGATATSPPEETQAASQPEPAVIPASPPQDDVPRATLPDEPSTTNIENPTSESPVSAPAHEDTSPEVAAAVPTSHESARFAIESIRVSPERLDGLMNQSGELTVAALRISRRPQELEALLTLEQEWTRDLNNARRLAAELRTMNGNTKQSTVEGLLRYLEEERDRMQKLEGMLQGVQRGLADDSARLELVATRLDEGVRSVRMLPMSTLFGFFGRMVRDLSRQEEKSVRYQVEGAETMADKRIIEEMKDPLMHMLRNSVDHGIETPAERLKGGKAEQATLAVRAKTSARHVIIEIQDDGRGLETAAIRRKALEKGLVSSGDLEAMTEEEIHQLIFSPGFSTKAVITDVSGRGVGMDVVRQNIEALKGSISIESKQGAGTLFRISIPTAVTTTRVLLVTAANQTFAIPSDAVVSTRTVKASEFFTMEGRSTLRIGQAAISVVSLSDLLGLPGGATAQNEDEDPVCALFVIASGSEQLAITVDALTDETEVILKQFGSLLRRAPNIAGGTILEDGRVCVVLSPRELIQTQTRRAGKASARAVDSTGEEEDEAQARRQVILLVEDSITTRMQEKRILEGAGYEVIMAVDGQDGYSRLVSESSRIDAIVTDVEMPVMDGFELTERVRANESYKELPIVIVTTLAKEEHRRRGMEVGADAYITKGGFDQSILLDTLRRLV